MSAKRILSTFAVVVVLGAAFCAPANGQCILANPSFEIAGSGGAVFGGWNQFNLVGSTGEASHGAAAARVTGPNWGSWEMSGFWQSQDCAPGEQWEATGHVRHPSGRPLVGGSRALVNVEWRDAADELISFDSFTAADAASPTDEFLDFSFLSGPAPAGTVKARLVLGVVQDPAADQADAHFDQVTFYSTAAPTIDDIQWNDFPGGKTLDFGGRAWRVKGPGWYGPGYNYFCDAGPCVWVDESDRLHLTLQYVGGTWACTEVVTDEALGYGDYVLTTVGRLDLIDPQVVLGMFLWEYGPCWDYGYLWWNPFNEIDIEYSRWGDPGSDLAQFVAQPYDYPGNISRFDAAFADDELVSHAMRWLADRVEYRVWRGGPDDESPETTIHAWTYAGPHIPRPEQPRMHLNLWKLDGTPAANQEVVFDDFTFIPEGGTTDVADGSGVRIPVAPAGRLLPAAPNPFNPRTTILFTLDSDGAVQLEVFDLAGRRVRTLADGSYAAGEHRLSWEGRDDEGRRLNSGVYLLRLKGSGFVATRRVALVQ